MEETSFEEQIKYFYHAKYIICAHGACMSNMVFCKPNTHLFEVVCNKRWEFFHVLSNCFGIRHHKILNNHKNIILQRFLNVYNGNIQPQTQIQQLQKRVFRKQKPIQFHKKKRNPFFAKRNVLKKNLLF